MVILPGSVYVTAGTTRRSTGTHYTPPSLTEPIVQHTLEPLVYLGPAEGLPQNEWQLKSPKQILELNVCDMAMGSGAFLVQACRYLSERLAESWENEEKKHPDEILITPEGEFSQGTPSERLIPQEAVERLAIARRIVADRCLYGVDINPMAVEMAKLSMWLITLDAKRPFTFLDHAFKCGDSLLGLRSFKQLEDFTMRPEEVKQVAFSTMNLWRHIKEARTKRELLENLPSDTPEQVAQKNVLNDEAEEATAKLKAAADILAAVEFKGLKSKAYSNLREDTADRMMLYWAKGIEDLRRFSIEQLGGRRVFHWPIEFPEVMDRGGFDAILGNPPFLGGTRISLRLGTEYLNSLYAVHTYFGNRSDLVSVFFCTASVIAAPSGFIGLIGTDTIAEGDTRDCGLQRIITAGCTIYLALRSIPWPGAATQRVSVVHFARGAWEGLCSLDERGVSRISAFLDESANDHTAFSLRVNAGLSFEGAKPAATGFVLDTDEAQSLLRAEPSSSDVLFPYLRGEELNSRPDQSPCLWVIDFGGRSLDEAGHYPACLAIVRERVKPVRDLVNRKAHRERWWMHGELRPGLYEAIRTLDEVTVHAFTSKHVAFAIVPNSARFAAPMNVFAFSDRGRFAALQSSLHATWAVKYCSTMGTRIRYTRTEIFETFPFPNTDRLIGVGDSYHRLRKEIMTNRQEGLTDIYNRFNDPQETGPDIIALRQLHIQLDREVCFSYEWSSLDLDYGFYETKLGLRYTLSESTRREVLDRLLKLNHQRHADEKVEEMLLGKQPNKSIKRGRDKASKALEEPTLQFETE